MLVSSLLCLACANASDVCDDDCEFESYSSRVNSAGDAKDREDRRRRARVFATSLATSPPPHAALVAGAVSSGNVDPFAFPLFAAPLGVLLVARAARAILRVGEILGARGALVAAAAAPPGSPPSRRALVVAGTAYFKGYGVVDALFGEALRDADARAKRLADLLNFVRGFTNDFIATDVAWFETRAPRWTPFLRRGARRAVRRGDARAAARLNASRPRRRS